jgi:hypothetical protein
MTIRSVQTYRSFWPCQIRTTLFANHERDLRIRPRAGVRRGATGESVYCEAILKLSLSFISDNEPAMDAFMPIPGRCKPWSVTLDSQLCHRRHHARRPEGSDARITTPSVSDRGRGKRHDLLAATPSYSNEIAWPTPEVLERIPRHRPARND